MNEPQWVMCNNCGREWADCCCGKRLGREDDRRRAKKHRSDYDDVPPSWDDITRAYEDNN